MIKVFHLIKSLDRGGAESLLRETLMAHDRNTFEFAYGYFLSYRNQVVEDLKVQGVRVHCFQADTPVEILFKSGKVADYIRAWGADIVHCHLPLAGFTGRLAHRLKKLGIPLVYTEHNTQERYHLLSRLANLATINWNDQILCVSEEVERSLRLRTNGRHTAITTLQNGVNTGYYCRKKADREKKRRELGIPPEAVVIGLTAVFRPQKQLERWIELASKLLERRPKVYFLLVGWGPQEEKIHAIANKMNKSGRMILPGYQSDIRPWLAAMDLFFMTSRFEGLPIAMLEAMSMQLPVVSPAVGGIPEVVRHRKEGLLAASGDTTLLLSHLEALLDHPEKRKNMGKNARQRVVEHFSIEKMVEKLEYIYTDLIERQLP